MLQRKGYLEGLNTLRFIAAMLVLIGHCTQNLLQLNIHMFSPYALFNNGVIAVEYFFVLSGFLLTDLAIKEFKNTGSINIKSFFLRRVFRIFPLYYLAVFLAYILLGVIYPMLNGKNYFSFPILEVLPYHFLMLPNYVICKWGENIGSLYSLWSIGVEEQFYLLFPFFMVLLLKNKNILVKIILITSIFFYLYWFISTKHFLFIGDIGTKFIATLKFHFMLIGCIFAILINNYKQTISIIINNRVFQILIWFLFFVSISLSVKYDSFDIIKAIVFAFLILIVSNKNNRLFNIEIKPFVYLGSISYGIYIFHPIVSYPIRLLIEKSFFFKSTIIHFPIVYYVTEFLLTIVVAHISFKYFESYFLRIRLKFTKNSNLGRNLEEANEVIS